MRYEWICCFGSSLSQVESGLCWVIQRILIIGTCLGFTSWLSLNLRYQSAFSWKFQPWTTSVSSKESPGFRWADVSKNSRRDGLDRYYRVLRASETRKLLNRSLRRSRKVWCETKLDARKKLPGVLRDRHLEGIVANFPFLNNHRNEGCVIIYIGKTCEF